MQKEATYLGVDVGGTRLKIGLVCDGAVISRAIVPVHMTSVDALVATIATAGRQLAAESERELVGVGVGIAGVLGVGGGPVLKSPNLPWLDGVDLRSPLAEALGVGVRCDNDANCVGWGEAMAGAGRGQRDQICLALGTGVGGSLIIDGRLEHGGRGRGTEVGHICVEPFGAPCGCGGRGCLEQYASQTGLLRMMREVGLSGTGPDAMISLFANAAANEPRATAIVAHAGRALAIAMSGLTRLTGVCDYVFAGGIAGALPQLRSPIEAGLKTYQAPSGIQIVAGTLGADAGVIGAALLGS